MATSILEEILHEARAAGASDVHLTAGIPPRMRVNGKLIAMNYPRLIPAETLDILLGVLPEALRGRFEERGEYSFSFSVPEGGRCRANAYRQKGSVAMALRLVDAQISSLEELGAPEIVSDLCRLESCMVLVTGPSGSGKSTTLAAMLNHINNSKNIHILTLENPIEYLHQHNLSMVNQREIGLDSMSYANALDAALREDPDVIMVGELPDADTVSAAIRAAEAGCLVLAALNADVADDVADHIIEMFPFNHQEQIRKRLSKVLKAVVFQQLTGAQDGGRRQAVFEVLPAGGEVSG